MIEACCEAIISERINKGNWAALKRLSCPPLYKIYIDQSSTNVKKKNHLVPHTPLRRGPKGNVAADRQLIVSPQHSRPLLDKDAF